MDLSKQNFFIIIIAATLLFLLLVGFIIALALLFQKRRAKHVLEIWALKQTYEQTLLQTQLEIQEHTFNYISQELHDNIGQILSLARVQANIMGESGSGNGNLLSGIKENIDKALADLRDIARSLSSERIKALNLYKAANTEANRVTKSGIMQAVCLLQGQEREIDGQKKLILFRMIQESLQNGIKHSSASRINMLFNYETDGLEIVIQDDGKGFDLQKSLEQKSGLGLQNMAARAALVGAVHHIESILNKGTTITIKIPYESD